MPGCSQHLAPKTIPKTLPQRYVISFQKRFIFAVRDNLNAKLRTIIHVTADKRFAINLQEETGGRLPPKNNVMASTLKELYEHSIATFALRPCSSLYEGEALTYESFGQRVEMLVRTLTVAGLSSGDKVALYSNNMPNWAVSYFAATISGMVIVPILPDFSEDEVNLLLEHSEAKALIISDKLFGKISRNSIERLNVVIRAVNLSVISQRCDVPGTLIPPEPGDLAAIIYTSGTTSLPKGVMLSHRNLCRQLEMVNRLQEIHPEDILLSILPLAHTYECSLGMLLPFRQGASVVYLDKAPTASVLLPAMKAVRPTMMLSVPLIIEKLYRNKMVPLFTRNRFMAWVYRTGPGRRMLHRLAGKRMLELFGGRLRFFGIGGAKLDPVVERFLLEGRFPYAIGYGLTETSPLLAGVNPSMVRLQSTGPMISGVEARLDNVNPRSGEGEIVVKGDNVMMGYYKNPEATAESFTPDGWFRTKDLGLFDADGYLYIKGRLGNMILGPSGENIYPEEIENVINSHAFVNDSLVKEDMGQLVAIVNFDREQLSQKYHEMREELEYRVESLKKELMHYVNSKVSRFSRISMVEENKEGFEKTPTQKIKRFLYSNHRKNKG